MVKIQGQRPRGLPDKSINFRLTAAIDAHIVTVTRYRIYQTLIMAYSIPGTKCIQSSVANQSIKELFKIIHLPSPEQDSNHPSSSKSIFGGTTNHQYATLPGLQPVHDGDSHKQETPAKTMKLVTTNNAA